MNRRRLMLMSGGWHNVTVPNAAFSWLPFTIQQQGRRFRPAPSFSLQAHANITVAKEYYVDVATGNDAWAGDSFAAGHPLKSIATALAKADVDRVIIKAGYYYSNYRGATMPDRDVEMIAYGGVVYNTFDTYNALTGAWALVDSHYERTTTATVSDIWDAAYPSALGLHVRLTKMTSVAEVDATAGSWWQNGANIYVHTTDLRSPDTNVKYYAAATNLTIARDSRTYYFEGIHFLGGLSGVRASNLSVAGGLHIYFKDCHFGYAYNRDTFWTEGVDEAILQNCKCYGGTTLDGFHYAILNGVVSNIVEIDCESYFHGAGAGHQASSTHDAITAVRIGGKYHHTTDHNIRDIGGGSAWLLGCECYLSTTGLSLNFTRGAVWLDCCWSHDNATSDLLIAGGTAYIRNFISGGNFTGTVVAY